MTIHPVPGPVHQPGDLVGGDDRLRELFFFDMMAAGYCLARRGFIALSLPVTDDDIEGFIGAVDRWLGRW
jgi:glutamate-1-semialdehyde 2,1-aminomutase